MEARHSPLEGLALELLCEVSIHLTQEEIGRLRLVSRACARLSVQDMLRTLPFSLNWPSMARLGAIGKVPALSGSVRNLVFNVYCTDQAAALSLADVKRLYVVEETRLAQLAPGHIADIRSREVCSSDLSADDFWDYNSPPGWDQDPSLKWQNWTDRCMLRHFLGKCLEKFHKVKEICVHVDGYCFTFTLPGYLKISEHMSLSSVEYLPAHCLVEWLFADLKRLYGYGNEYVHVDVDIRKRLKYDLIFLLPPIFTASAKRIFLNSPASSTALQNGSRDAQSIRDARWSQDFRFQLITTILLESYADLKDVEIKFPYRGAMDEIHDISSLVSTALKHPRLSRLDLGNLSVKEQDLTEMLEKHQVTLRDLKLTKVSFRQGDMIGWFSRIGLRLNNLQRVAFHDSFWEGRTKRVVDMDTPAGLDSENLSNKEVEPHSRSSGRDKPETIGFKLGEMCLARQESSLLNNQTLRILESMMKPISHVELEARRG